MSELHHWLLAWPLIQVAIGGGEPCRPRCVDPARCVVIDPGHPSEVNAGTTRVHGTTERDVNWRMARLLERQLVAEGLEVLLTRSDSLQSMTNRARAEMANCAGPALMVRLHADAGPIRGFAVFYADREGRAQGRTGPPPNVRAASERWAAIIEREMRQRLPAQGLPARGMIGESRSAVGSRQGALTGSIFSQVPTVLVEMVVLTNAQDAAFIKSGDGQLALVDAMARGIQAGIAQAAISGTSR